MHAQDAVVVGVRKDLHQAGALVGGQRATGGRERELAGAVGLAVGLEFLLGLAHPGDLRMGVDDRRDAIVVDQRFVASQPFDHHDPFLHALVRQHGTAHHVADGVDLRRIGGAKVVDEQKAALIEVHAAVLGEQALGERHPTHSDDQLVDVELVIALLVLVFDLDAGLGDGCAHDPGSQADVEALSAEFSQRVPGNARIGHGKEILQCLVDHHVPRRCPAPSRSRRHRSPRAAWEPRGTPGRPWSRR